MLAMLGHSLSHRRIGRLAMFALSLALRSLVMSLFVLVPCLALAQNTGTITTVAGNGTAGYAGDGGLAINAQLNQPVAVASDSAGNLLIADTLNYRIRKVDAKTGLIQTIAGNGTVGYAGDGGPATEAEFGGVYAVFVDKSDNIFIADSGNGVIREIVAVTGIIRTVAGNGIEGFSGDGGPATQAELDTPMGVFVDGADNIFIADTFNNRIREVSAATGVIQTIAGSGPFGIENGGFGGYAGDGGPATSAELGCPTGVYGDAAGNIFIGDEGTAFCIPGIGMPLSAGIREVSAATGIINRVAGFGNEAGCGGWPATIQFLTLPFGVLVDPHGNIFTDCNLRYLIEIPSTGDVVQQIAGNGVEGYSGDGQFGTTAELDLSSTVQLGPGTGGGITEYANSLYIADIGNNRIRKVAPFAAGALPALTISTAPFGLLFPPQDFGVPSAPMSVKVTSFGTLPLTLTSAPTFIPNPNPDLGPPNYRIAPDEFAVAPSSACSVGTPIQSGTSCTIDITATPNVAQFLQGFPFGGEALISEADDASSSPHTYPVTDRGLIPAKWGNVNFLNGTVDITTTQALPITNSGNLPLTFQAASTINGLNASDFAVATGTTCTAGSTLTIGATCNIEISFMPGDVGERSATLTAYLDAGDTPVQLLGAGNGPGNTAAILGFGSRPGVDEQGGIGSGLFFPGELVNTTSPTQSLSIVDESNGGINDVLKITSTPTITGTNASDFAILSGSTCSAGLTIQVAGSCTIKITFTPTALGGRTATLTIFDNGTGVGGLQGSGSQTMTLIGQGVAPNAPAVTFDVKSVTFTGQAVGTSSALQNAVLTNTGKAPLTINSIAITGANAGDFKAATSCPLAPLVLTGGCPITISFAPVAAGTRTAMLSVVDNAPGSPQTVALTGTAVDFSISAPAGQTSATVTAGQTATYNLQLAPAGFAGTVTLACIGAPAGATCTASPSSLLLDGSTPASFTVSVATRARSATGPRDLLMPYLPQAWPVFLAFALALFGVFGCIVGSNAKRKLVFASIVLALACTLTACTGGNGSTGEPTTTSVATAQGTPPGSSVLTVTAVSGSITRMLALSLTVN